MEFEIYKIESSENGFVGYELLVEGKSFCVFADQSFLSGLRIGCIVQNLTETLTRTLVYSEAAQHPLQSDAPPVKARVRKVTRPAILIDSEDLLRR